MMKNVLIGLGLLIAGILLLAALRPSDFRIERSLVMPATPAQIYPHLSSTKLSNAWSPFISADPETQITYEGPESGVGAKTSWVSKKMGEGTATITEAVPNEKVVVRLDFLKPFAGTNMTEYLLAHDDHGTKVIWSMYGKNTYLQRLVCMFMNQDKMVGEYFENGLNTLKSRVSATAAL